MEIIKYDLLPRQELLARLRRTPLRGFPGVEVYENSNLFLQRQADTDSLIPPQRYVLNPGVQTILDIADHFETQGIDVFSLEGALLFWTKEMNPETDTPVPFLPPIVEEAQSRAGYPVLVIADGMHRVWAARKRNRMINVVLVRNIPEAYPYYAYPMMEGWGAVKEFDELPDEFLKKDYRNPENYKMYFRQYNFVFPGVQEQRKQSNPAHIKA